MKVILIIVAVLLVCSMFITVFSFDKKIDSNTVTSNVNYGINETYSMFEVIPDGDSVVNTYIPNSMSHGINTTFMYKTPKGSTGSIVQGTSQIGSFEDSGGDWAIMNYTWTENDQASDLQVKGLTALYVLARPEDVTFGSDAGHPNENKIESFNSFQKTDNEKYPFSLDLSVDKNEFYICTIKSGSSDFIIPAYKEGVFMLASSMSATVQGKSCAFAQYILRSDNESFELLLNDSNCQVSLQKVAMYEMNDYFQEPPEIEGPGAEDNAAPEPPQVEPEWPELPGAETN